MNVGTLADTSVLTHIRHYSYHIIPNRNTSATASGWVNYLDPATVRDIEETCEESLRLWEYKA